MFCPLFQILTLQTAKHFLIQFGLSYVDMRVFANVVFDLKFIIQAITLNERLDYIQSHINLALMIITSLKKDTHGISGKILKSRQK